LNRAQARPSVEVMEACLDEYAPVAEARCPTCFLLLGEEAASCTLCRSGYHAGCWPEAGCSIAGCARPSKPKARNGWVHFTLAELVIVLVILGVLAAIAVPNFEAARVRANTRACYANQKTIVGAMEMYGLDTDPRRTVLDTAWFTALKSGGYLQSVPQDPGQGAGTSSHYRATSGGNGITCSVHGTIQ
jgi:prepilin-type N-terminal cleavage/methylation domain-containing protein